MLQLHIDQKHGQGHIVRRGRIGLTEANEFFRRIGHKNQLRIRDFQQVSIQGSRSAGVRRKHEGVPVPEATTL